MPQQTYRIGGIFWQWKGFSSVRAIRVSDQVPESKVHKTSKAAVPGGVAFVDRRWYTCVHIFEIGGMLMAAVKVGIREFREKLASYVLESDTPVAITRHGDTVGYYIPARRKRSEAERTALREAASRLQKMLEAEGISEEEIVADFKRWRAGRRK